MCKTSLLWVPPFSKDMRVQACCLFASELLLLSMCKLSCFPDHFPLVDIPLKKAPQPDFDESVCITQFGSFCLSDLPLFNLKFSFRQRSSCFDRLSNTIYAWYKQAWFRDCICCCWNYLSFRRVGRSAWTVEDIRSLNFVNFKTVI